MTKTDRFIILFSYATVFYSGYCPCSRLHNGAIVLADSGESNERMELRRYHRLPSYTLLIPENEIMGERKSMFVTVYGILISIRRSYELPAARS